MCLQVDAADMLAKLSGKHRVKFAPGTLCKGSKKCVRLSFAFYTPEEITEGVQRLARVVEEYCQGE